MRAGILGIIALAASTAAADPKAKDVLGCDRGDAKACERACKDSDGIACTQRGLADPAKGKAWFEAACTAGETFGCKLVAQIAERATPQDLPLAAATYRKACAIGSETSCARVGMSKEEKVPVAVYTPRLIEAIRAACSAKHQPSCTELGALYITGNGVTADVNTGLAAFDTACAGGELWACSNLGIQLGRNADTAKSAIDLLERACTGGIAHACLNLGLQLAESKHIANDLPRAATLFDKACNLGHAMGCSTLGRVYASGLGVTKDLAKAEKLYAKSCAALSSGGCAELGTLTDGDHGPANFKVSFDAFVVACERGHARGCTGLGLAYHRGNGVTKDLVKAREYYTRACAKKSGAACNNLGILWNDGEGGGKDPAKATDHYRLGCEYENGRACVNYGTTLTDKTKQLDTFDKGCKLGEKSACTKAADARKK
jgi:TPR repeat protein